MDRPDVEDVEEFLAHFGVKGMKWGVRKERNVDFVVSKDNPIYNISAGASRNISGQVYGAFTKHDVVNYRSAYASQLRGLLAAPDVFSNAFDLKRDLKVAGEKTQIAAFKELWESDKSRMAKSLAESQVDISFAAAIINRGFKIDRTKAYEKRFMEASEEYMMKKGFRQYQSSLGIRTNNYRTPYYSLLAKRGYTALLDMNDVRGYGSEQPILIFKGKDHLKNKKSLELKGDDVQLAMNAYFNKKVLGKYDIHELHAKHGEAVNEFLMHWLDAEGGMTPVDDANDFLAHFGIKGMKWGVRKKDTGPPSSDAARVQEIKGKAKVGKAQALSNKELQDAITRMNLEQQYKRLAINDKPFVKRYIASTLTEIGSRSARDLVVNEGVKFLTKSVRKSVIGV